MDKASPLVEEQISKEKVGAWSHILGFLAVLVIGSIVSFFRLTGRVRIEGAEHLRNLPRKNVLFTSNHPSMLDFYLLLFVIAGWRGLLNPRLIPWQACDRRNFTWMTRWTRASFKSLRLVPVNRGGADVKVLRPLLSALSSSWVLLFPEAGRSAKRRMWFCTANGVRIGEPKEGVGALIFAKNPIIIPILLKGTHNVAPIGATWGVIPNIWRHRVWVTVGKPYQSEQISAESKARMSPEQKKAACSEITGTAMVAIADLGGGVLV